MLDTALSPSAECSLDQAVAAERSLDQAVAGSIVHVLGVDGDDAIARRLVDLGFRPGTEVRVDRVAPLGDPIQYRLHGYRLALRRSEARRVRVMTPR